MSRTRKIASAGAVGLFAITTIGAPGAGVEPPRSAPHRHGPVARTTPTCTRSSAPTSPTRSPSSPTTRASRSPPAAPTSTPSTPTSQYWIKVDNTGDGVEDVTYTFQFTTDVANPDSFLYSGYGPIPGAPANVTQTAVGDPQRRVHRHRSGRCRRRTSARAPRPSTATIAANGVNALTAAAATRSSRLRRPARRPVLRRPRRHLRPGRSAARSTRRTSSRSRRPRARTTWRATTSTASPSRCPSRS